MTPTALRLRNVGSFADLQLELPAGCVALVGANGAGKSTIMHAIEIALFGPRGRTLAPLLRDGETDMEITLMFDHAGGSHRIRRTFNRKRTTLDLDRLDGDAWQPLTLATTTDTQTLIEQTIGLSRDTYLASGYLAQGNGESFTAAQPRDRKRIVSGALGLDMWDAPCQAVAADRKAAAARVAELDGRVSALAERVQAAAGLEAERDRLTGLLAGLDQRAAEAQAAVDRAVERLDRTTHAEHAWKLATAEHREAVAAFETLKDQIDAAAAARARLRDEQEACEILQREAATHAQLAAQVADGEHAERARIEAERERGRLLDESARLGREAESLRAQLAAIAAKRVAIEHDPDAECDRCGQHLPDEARQTALRSLIDERAEAAAIYEQLVRRAEEIQETAKAIVLPDVPADLDDLRAREAELAEAPVLLAACRERISQLETAAALDSEETRTRLAQLAAEVTAKLAALERLDEPEPGLTQHAQAAVLAARACQEAARAEQQTAAAQLARAAALADAARADTEQLAQAEHERAEQQARHDDLAVLERAFGRNGVPAWITEQHALPAIETEANRILGELGGPVQRVELRTERELKKGGTTDALDIVCHTTDGERDYQTFSGGERTRVQIALRLALARLLAHRRDADIRMLCLDEPDGLDTSGTEALAGVLRGLVADGVVSTTILASHDTNLRDRFDEALLVTATDSGSEVRQA